MENKNVTINISTSTVLKVVGVFLVLGFAYLIQDIILIVFISIIIAAIIEPIVDLLEDKSKLIIKRKIPRGLLVLFIYILFVFLLYFMVQLILPPIVEQVANLTRNFPDLWEKIVSNFNSLKEYSEDKGLIDNIQKGLSGIQSGLESAAGGIYSFIGSVFSSVINFFLILAIVFYLVVERNAVKKLFSVIAPPKYHSYLAGLFNDIQKKIGSWAQGQLILGLIIGGLSFVGLLFFLPKYALSLALIAGVTEIVPYLGPLIGAVPAVFLGFAVPPFSLSRGFAILVLYIVIQQVEEKIIVPKVMQNRVGMNPVVTIIVMLIGFRLAGIIGLILAVPVATAVGIIAKDFINKSELPRIRDEVED